MTVNKEDYEIEYDKLDKEFKEYKEMSNQKCKRDFNYTMKLKRKIEDIEYIIKDSDTKEELGKRILEYFNVVDDEDTKE